MEVFAVVVAVGLVGAVVYLVNKSRKGRPRGGGGGGGSRDRGGDIRPH